METGRIRLGRRIISFIAAAVIAAAYVFPAAMAEGETISISNADELVTFFENCRGDVFSRGKKFVLEADIDMSGKRFTSGEIFCGEFDGKSHTIKNVSLELNENNGGLFGIISESGRISDLNISGIVTQKEHEEKSMDVSSIVSGVIKNAGISGISPKENTWITGGIASVNNGTISGCTMSGSVSGKKTTGGIAGKNNQSGIIDGCSNYADAYGVQNTGGIVGENYGRIRNSKNDGVINPKAEETTQNTGGISGYNEGVIESGTNNGSVGCEGYGTNTGGIAGKQSGCILESVNYGEVGGKKNVGGVTGIFVPFSDIEISMDELRDQIDDDKQRIKDDIKDIKDDIHKQIDDLKDGIFPALGLFGNLEDGSNRVLDSLANYIDNASRRADRDSESTNRLKERIGDAVDKAGNSIENVGDSAARESSERTQIIRDTADSLSEAADSINESVSSTSDSINNAVSSASDSINSRLSDTSNLDNISNETVNTLKDLDSQLNTITNSLTDTLDRTDTTHNEVIELLDTVTTAVNDGNENRADITASVTDALDSIDLNMESLDEISDSLASASRSISRAVSNLEGSTSDVSKGMTSLLRSMNSLVSNANDSLNTAKADLQSVKDKINAMKQKLDELKNMFPSKSTPALSSGKVNVGKAIMSLFETTAYADETTKFLDDIFDTTAIKEEMKKVISVDIALDRNIAGEYADNALVQYCMNFGTIAGTSNTGGIAGTMGVESLRSNGDTITLPNGKPIVSDMVMKAVINECENDGYVYSKNDRCGGIVGNASIGIIKNSLGAGIVGNEDSEYSGAISGDSLASIMFCAGAAEVNGKSDVGGIAGKGNNIHSTYSISVPNPRAERAGTIAGSVDGSLRNNCFLDEGVGGIGGTNYESDAEGLSFEEMIGTDKLPEKMDMLFNEDWYVGQKEFPQIRALAENDAKTVGDLLKEISYKYAMTTFKVIFKDDGKVLKEVMKEYGEELSDDEIPQLEKRDGYYPHWDRDTSKPIKRHTTFNAAYDEATSTIASDQDPPYILIEGIFSESSEVIADEREEFGNFGVEYKVIRAYSVDVRPSKDKNGNFRYHVLDRSKKGDAIGIVSNGESIVVDTERDGNYLVCNIGEITDVVVLSKRQGALLAIYIILAAALVFLAAAVIIARKRKLRNRIKAYIKRRREALGEKSSAVSGTAETAEEADKEEQQSEDKALPESAE